MTLVLLTGATRGIGRAAAIELAREGVEVALVGREAERVKDVAREAQATGGGAPVHQHVADLTLMADVRALAAEVSGSYSGSTSWQTTPVRCSARVGRPPRASSGPLR